MINRISEYLWSMAGRKWFFIALVGYLLMGAVVMPLCAKWISDVAGKPTEILDLQFGGYTTEKAHNIIAVYGDEGRALVRPRSGDRHVDAEKACDLAVIPMGKARGRARPEPEEKLLHGHQRQGKGGKAQQQQCRAHMPDTVCHHGMRVIKMASQAGALPRA